MDVRSMPPTNAAAGATSVVGTPPRLGAPVPGTTGGLPALGGLSVLRNPMAQELQSMGRGEDSMLVHMTPGEVQGLQQLAMATGGSLTINPHTGLPEAGWLGKLLPTIAGFALNFIPGIGPFAAAAITAAGSTVATGDLKKGLLAGLGAWGGASLSGALLPTATATPTILSTGALPGTLSSSTAETAAEVAAPAITTPATSLPADFVAPELAASQTANLTPSVVAGAKSLPADFLSGVTGSDPGIMGRLSNFAAASRTGIPTSAPGFVSKAAPYAAGLGLFGSVSDALQPKLPKYEPEKDKWNYRGPYVPTPRTSRVLTPEEQTRFMQGEALDFGGINPVPGFRGSADIPEEEKKLYGFAAGGPVSGGGKGGQSAGGGSPLSSYASPFMSSFAPTAPSFAPVSPMAAPAAAPSGKGARTSFGGLGGLLDYYGSASPGPVYAPNTYAQSGNPFLTDILSTSRERPHFFSTSAYPRSQPTSYGGMYDPMYGAINIPTQNNTVPASTRSGVAGVPIPENTPAAVTATTPTTTAATTAPGTTLPIPYVDPSQGPLTKRMNRGGGVHMGDGSFVLDARTVSELGNGSSNAGRELLARMGGRPLDGPGDGVSDSIPARIGGRQEARVARDEVIMPPEAVRRIGKGDSKRGADKLYALMDKAHKARKKAKRGQDTKLARGLGAIA